MTPPRILILDDDLFMRKLIEVMLLREGYQVFQAETAAAAFDLLQSETVDLITCDLMMPDTDGLSFLRKLKENPDYQAIPVLIITAAGLRDVIDQAMALGATSYLEKPFTDSEIRLAVVQALETYITR
jgi:two-component system response regulator (stage 0 sporulation protein F)